MKNFFAVFSIIISLSGLSQTGTFPQNWIGNWKGELKWFKTGVKEPQTVVMELRIQPADSLNKYTWHLIYGSPTEDSRPYTLIAKDTAKGHWIIDENNGIVIDQFWVANKFCGAFTVMNSTIFNNYWFDNDRLIVEFLTIGAKATATTGKGNDEVPFVHSYRVSGYQKAVLTRQQ